MSMVAAAFDRTPNAPPIAVIWPSALPVAVISRSGIAISFTPWPALVPRQQLADPAELLVGVVGLQPRHATRAACVVEQDVVETEVRQHLQPPRRLLRVAAQGERVVVVDVRRRRGEV